MTPCILLACARLQLTDMTDQQASNMLISQHCKVLCDSMPNSKCCCNLDMLVGRNAQFERFFKG